MNCVITGGTGLIGRRLIKRLLAKEHSIFSIVHRASDVDNTQNYLQFVFDFSAPNRKEIPSCSKQIDAVVHLVQSNNYRDFPNSAADIFYTNLDSTFNMLEFARKNNVKTFILASSGGIYGAGTEVFKENKTQLRYEELGFYLNTKMCAEILADNYKKFMNVIILRFFFVYGELQKSIMLLPRLAASISSGVPIVLQGLNGININPIYVDDAVEAIVRALSLNNSYCINVAGREVVNLRQLSVMMGDIMHKTPVFKIEEKEPQHVVADIEQMKEKLVEPKVMLQDGLNRLICSMRERGLICN